MRHALGKQRWGEVPERHLVSIRPEGKGEKRARVLDQFLCRGGPMRAADGFTDCLQTNFHKNKQEDRLRRKKFVSLLFFAVRRT